MSGEFSPGVSFQTIRGAADSVAALNHGRSYLPGASRGSGLRHFTTARNTAHSSKQLLGRTAYPKSKVRLAVDVLSGRSPFASTLRPNLTGGTLNRTAGGYAFGGGHSARYFSHSPSNPAHVVQQVSQAVRAFLTSGRRAQFDGADPRTGSKRFKTTTALQEATTKKVYNLPRSAPGAFVEFNIHPTITAVSSLQSASRCPEKFETVQSLKSDGLLDILSADFARAFKDLAIILKDLHRLISLGDLPITHQHSYIRVHFPGCDCETIQLICDELGVQRGVVGQDEDFDAFAGTEIALRFPFAPSKAPSEWLSGAERSYYSLSPTKRNQIHWSHLMTTTPMSLQTDKYGTDGDGVVAFSDVSESGSFSDTIDFETFPLSSSHNSDYQSASIPASVADAGVDELEFRTRLYSITNSTQVDIMDYQGFGGIYRFIELCDNSAQRLRDP